MPVPSTQYHESRESHSFMQMQNASGIKNQMKEKTARNSNYFRFRTYIWVKCRYLVFPPALPCPCCWLEGARYPERDRHGNSGRSRGKRRQTASGAEGWSWSVPISSRGSTSSRGDLELEFFELWVRLGGRQEALRTRANPPNVCFYGFCGCFGSQPWLPPSS